MIFESIKDFLDIMGKCPICDNLMITELLQLKRSKFTLFSVNHKANFSPIEQEILSILDSENVWKSSYASELIDNNLLTYFSYEDKKFLLFSIDIHTNKISFNTINLKEPIWNCNFVLTKACLNNLCVSSEQNYLVQSYPLVKKDNKILPTRIRNEMLSVNDYNKNYFLISEHDKDKSFILVNNKLVSNLPLVRIHEIKNKETFLNKMKTLVIFI